MTIDIFCPLNFTNKPPAGLPAPKAIRPAVQEAVKSILDGALLARLSLADKENNRNGMVHPRVVNQLKHLQTKYDVKEMLALLNQDEFVSFVKRTHAVQKELAKEAHQSNKALFRYRERITQIKSRSEESSLYLNDEIARASRAIDNLAVLLSAL